MMIVNKKYKLNKEWLDLMLENKNNTNLTFNLSDNDTRILLTYIEVLQQENARLKDKLKDIKKILDADCCVENIYQAMCQYLNIHDFELNLEDYLKEN